MSDTKNKFKISRPVFFIGLVSFFTDTASEAIYPLLPVFLTSVLGASPAFIGFIEGVAESTASLTKFLFGWISDKTGKREPLVIGGYAIANLVRPLIGLATTPFQVLGLRFTDRIGKGMRTAPRDAWLASLSVPETRARVYGFHRSMDHAGAVLGPLLASAFLWFYPENYRPLFLLTIVPGLLAIACIFLARKADTHSEQTNKPLPQSTSTFSLLPKQFKIYLGILLLFTLGNSSDAFILLKLKLAGVDVKLIPLLWAALHVVKSASSFYGGRFADAVGRKTSILCGWFFYAAIYFLLGWATDRTAVVSIFLAYGIYFGLTEGAEKALAAGLVPENARGTAFGLFNLMIGIGALPASFLFGYLWMKFGMMVAFSTGAGLALGASILLMLLPLKNT